MSLTGGHLDALLAAGATAEQIVALVKADMVEREAATKTRRAKDAERQRRHRESRDVTVTSAVSQDTPSPLEVSPQTPLPKTPYPNSPPLNPPVILEEKRQAVASCLRRAFPAPEGVTDEQWAAFRKQRKKPLNDRSYVLICNKLTELAEAGWPPGPMIDLAIERGWETVFKPRNFAHDRSDNPLGDAVTRILRAG